MEYIIVKLPPEEKVVVSYLVRECAAYVEYLKTSTKLLLKESAVLKVFGDIAGFKSFINHASTYKNIEIYKAKVDLSKLPKVKQAQIIFGTKDF